MTCNICGIDQLRRIHQTIAVWNAKQSPKVITCHKKTQIIKKKPNGNKVNPPNKGSIFFGGPRIAQTEKHLQQSAKQFARPHDFFSD